MSTNPFFVLASSSKSRMSILRNAGLRFRGTKHRCDEKNYKKMFVCRGYKPSKISLELSKLKAQSINIQNTLVIGSDTVIDFGGKTIDKATSISGAKKKIKKLSGKKHSIISSIAAYYNNKLIWCCTINTKVKIKKLGNAEINEYLKRCGPSILNSVGCYQLERFGTDVIEDIDGDHFNVMGFPIFPFLFFLKKFNVKK